MTLSPDSSNPHSIARSITISRENWSAELAGTGRLGFHLLSKGEIKRVKISKVPTVFTDGSGWQ